MKTTLWRALCALLLIWCAQVSAQAPTIDGTSLVAESGTQDTTSVVWLQFRKDGSLWWTPANQLWPWRQLGRWATTVGADVGGTIAVQTFPCTEALAVNPNTGQSTDGLMSSDACAYIPDVHSGGTWINVPTDWKYVELEPIYAVRLQGDESDTGTIKFWFCYMPLGVTSYLCGDAQHPIIGSKNITVTIHNFAPVSPANSFYVKPIPNHTVYTNPAQYPQFVFGSMQFGFWYGGVRSGAPGWPSTVQSGSWGKGSDGGYLGPYSECFTYPCNYNQSWSFTPGVKMKYDLISGDMSLYHVSGDQIVNDTIGYASRSTAITLNKPGVAVGNYTLVFQVSLYSNESVPRLLDTSTVTVIFQKTTP